MTINNYLPFHNNHSIQEAQVNLVFLGQFDQYAIEAARGVAQSELSEDFPQAAEVRGGTLQIDISNPVGPAPVGNIASDIVGFQLTKMQGNAQPARLLLLAANDLSIRIMDYQGWPVDLPLVLKYLNPILSSLPLAQNPVIGFGVRFIDSYTFNGSASEARADLLFVRPNPYITPHTFDSGQVWHCHTGWFDEEKGERVLHNLNVTSNIVDLASTVTIHHQSTVHLRVPRQSVATILDPPNATNLLGLTKALNLLHSRNKEILGKMLVKEMRDKIRLDQ